MSRKSIVVFASSFMDELETLPERSHAAYRALETFVAGSAERYRIELKCDRDPHDPVRREELSEAVGVIADLERYSAELLTEVGGAGGGTLRIIARYGVGTDSVALDAATRSGVVVANTPGANSLPTAEWSVATLLDVAGRRIPHHERARAGRDKQGPSRLDVYGRTLGVVGTGTIGRLVIGLLRGFNMEVLAYDPYPDAAWAEAAGAHYVAFEELLERADLITLHASVRHTIVGAAELACMKRNAVLVNCARGLLVDNRLAYEAVRSGALFGYGIDEVWPHPELSLAGLNIAASPHVGSDTDEGKARMQEASAAAVIDFLSGKRPQSVVNPAVFER